MGKEITAILGAQTILIWTYDYKRQGNKDPECWLRDCLAYLIDIITLNSDSSSNAKIVSEYDQEIPQLQTADNPIAPPGRVAQPSRDTKKKN